jgi:N-acetylglucosamine kinase-like BadF-type ATPase
MPPSRSKASVVLVGADVGASRTRVAVDGGDGAPRVIEAAGASPSVLGARAAGERLVRILEEAMDDFVPRAIILGVAGAWRASVARLLEEMVARRFPGARVEVTHDARIALRAVHPVGDGLVVLAGTGMIAYGESGGRSYRSGGYGHLIGDEGSGFSLGAAALRAAAQAYDGVRPRDELATAVARATGAEDLHALLAFAYERGDDAVARVAALAPTVIALADRGDRGATQLVQKAAAALAGAALAVARASGLHERETTVVLAGGLLERNSLLTYLLETRLQNELPLATVIKNSLPAWLGALSLARTSARADCVIEKE